MQCGCSQWRHAVGMCTFAYVAPASRSSRDTPPCVSAQAFSQLSQPTQSDSSMTSTLVASPSPSRIRKFISEPASGRTCMRALSITRRLTSFCSGSSRASSRTRQLEEFLALDLDGIGGNGRRRGLAATGSPISAISPTRWPERIFADQNRSLLAARQRDTARAQHEQRVADFAFLEQHLAGLEAAQHTRAAMLRRSFSVANGAKCRCSSRTTKIQSMPLRTSSLEFISLTIVRRGVSTRMQPGRRSPCRSAAVRTAGSSRRRIRRGRGACGCGGAAPSSVTSPSTIVKNEVPNSPGE